jgi:hypothetical protein
MDRLITVGLERVAIPSLIVELTRSAQGAKNAKIVDNHLELLVVNDDDASILGMIYDQIAEDIYTSSGYKALEEAVEAAKVYTYALVTEDRNVFDSRRTDDVSKSAHIIRAWYLRARDILRNKRQ